jgi:hypothetical protein
VDVEPIEIVQIRRNNRSREARVSKRINKFLVIENLIINSDRVRSWVEVG